MNKALQGTTIGVKYVQDYARRWPRSIFDCRIQGQGGKSRCLVDEPELELLKCSGVYILYRDDEPFYVGKTDGSLKKRLYDHAMRHGGPRTYFWNYFSVFVIDDPDFRTVVESLLIAAIPKAANSSNPRLKRTPMPAKVVGLLRQLRTVHLEGQISGDVVEDD
jgi:hypothetical protein